MKHLIFHFDVISPYAYLAFEALPQALLGISHRVTYKPLLFAALLKHHGQLGPAEIPGKRDWTYRQVLWLAHSQGLALDMPASHPFNPLPLLRLALACGSGPADLPNRYVCETLLRHVWRGGAEAAEPDRLAALSAQLAPRREPTGAAVKAQLTELTQQAIARGLFGVPTIEVDDKLFWGFDALPMLRAYLLGEPWFETEAWQAAAQIAVGTARPR